MINVSENDLVIGIGFPRYAARTIEALTFAQNRGAKVVAITDSLLSPLAAKADYTLIAQSNMASFVDSLVAPLSVINALIIAVGLREKEKYLQPLVLLKVFGKNMKFILTGIIKIKSTKIFIKNCFRACAKRGHFIPLFLFLLFSKI